MRHFIASRCSYRLLLVGLLCLLFAGCTQYQMQGVVVEGMVSSIRVLDKDDPRLLEGYPLPMAMVESTLDADRLNRKTLPRAISDVDGSFVVPVDETGAGYLDYYIRIVVRKAGYDTAITDMRIPGPDKLIFVTLARGEDKYKPEPEDLLEETMKMGEPYMQ